MTNIFFVIKLSYTKYTEVSSWLIRLLTIAFLVALVLTHVLAAASQRVTASMLSMLTNAFLVAHVQALALFLLLLRNNSEILKKTVI